MKIIGYIMCGLPFIGVVILGVKTIGWQMTLLAFLVVGAFIGWISLACHLIIN